LTREDIKAAAEAVRQARAQVTLAREQLSEARIVSPISGVIYQRQVDVGETVTPGQPFMNLAGLRSVYFEAQVPETEVTSLGVGSPVQVTVDAFPGRSFHGRVARIIPVATASTRDFRVRVSVAQEGDLLSPGAFARGNILVGRHPQALLVSKDAIQTALSGPVFVVVEGRRAASGGLGDGRNAGRSRVNDGAVVVVAGGGTLRDGTTSPLLNGADVPRRRRGGGIGPRPRPICGHTTLYSAAIFIIMLIGRCSCSAHFSVGNARAEPSIGSTNHRGLPWRRPGEIETLVASRWRAGRSATSERHLHLQEACAYRWVHSVQSWTPRSDVRQRWTPPAAEAARHGPPVIRSWTSALPHCAHR
jgi:hypothetical protein